MLKYDFAFKLTVVKAYIKGEGGFKHLTDTMYLLKLQLGNG